MCDQISDSVLDAFPAEDSEAHVACEAAVWPNHAVVFGEYISRVAVPFEEIVRRTIRDIGYPDPVGGFDANTCDVTVALHGQSPDINQGVIEALEVRSS